MGKTSEISDIISGIRDDIDSLLHADVGDLWEKTLNISGLKRAERAIEGLAPIVQGSLSEIQNLIQGASQIDISETFTGFHIDGIRDEIDGLLNADVGDIWGKVLNIPGLGIAVSAIEGLIPIVQDSLTQIQGLTQTADQIGISTQALSGFRYAAEVTGVSSQTLDSALQTMTARIAEAAQGTGAAQGALQALGVDIRSLSQMSPEQAFITIAGALGSVKGGFDKAQAAASIFGTENEAVLRTLNLGKEGLAQAAEEARAFGLAISDVDAAKVEAANAAIARAKGAFSGIAQTLTVELAPYIEVVAKGIAEIAKESDGFKAAIGAGVELAVWGAEKLVLGFSGLNIVFASLKYGFLAFQEKVWEGLHFIRKSITATLEALNVGGILDDQVAESRRIQGEQESILRQTAQDKEAALKAGAEALDLNDSLIQKVDKYRDAIVAASQAVAEETAKNKERSSVTHGAVPTPEAGPQVSASDNSAYATHGGAYGFGSGIAAGAGNGNYSLLPEGNSGGLFTLSEDLMLQTGAGAAADTQDQEIAAYRNQYAQKLQALRESLSTEEEAIQASYWNRWGIINESYSLGLMSEEEHSLRLKEIAEERDNALAEIERKRFQRQLQIAAATTSALMGLTNSLFELSGRKSKQMFELNKMAGIANVAVSTAVAIMNAAGTQPFFPLGLAMMAAAAASGVAQIAAIKSTSFEGGGKTAAAGSMSAGAGGAVSAPSGIAPVVTQPVQEKQEARQAITIVIEGHVLGEEKWVEERLAPTIKELTSRNVDFGFARA